jgi:hypothetical protein
LLASRSNLVHTAANEMDDLQPVSGVNLNLRPAHPLCDLAIVLHRDTVPLQIHSPDHLIESHGSFQVGKRTVLAIDNKGKWHDAP